ncbi:unnamed protein product [Lathyrus sativus]|nr:unnamed protein product [Lathyrus sativus]
MDLVDMPSSGNRFTWYSGDGNSMSKIHRFLVVDVIIDRWGVVGQTIGKRFISDYCLIWLKLCSFDWGRKPFKTNDS